MVKTAFDVFLRDGLDDVIEEGMKALQGQLRETIKKSLIWLYARDTKQTEASRLLQEEFEGSTNADFKHASVFVATGLEVTAGYINPDVNFTDLTPKGRAFVERNYGGQTLYGVKIEKAEK